MMTTMKRWTVLLLGITLGLIGCLVLFAPTGNAFALDLPDYTPGEDYRIDEERAFREQDIEHEGTIENESSTNYYLTSSFYLNWISPDMIIYEGEDAYIGCGAIGLDDIHYEWFLSKDGGNSFVPTGLVGNEHTVQGLTVNEPATQPYLYRCIITNGDQTSTLKADVKIIVLAGEHEDTGASGVSQTGSGLLKTGDITMPIIGISIVLALVALLTVVFVHKRSKKLDELELTSTEKEK